MPLLHVKENTCLYCGLVVEGDGVLVTECDFKHNYAEPSESDWRAIYHKKCWLEGM